MKAIKESKKEQPKEGSPTRVRSQVEHPFGYIKEKLGYRKAPAKTLERNSLRFDFNFILYNIFRAGFLLSKI